MSGAKRTRTQAVPELLEVWGDPISHSKSPTLHAAAYEHLGLDWEYSRRQVTKESFDRELVSARRQVRGLSLTMPLKELAYAAADRRDGRAMRTGAVNTLVFVDDQLRGFNTDIGGFLGALADHGVDQPESARVIGAGATAASAVIALAEAGARSVEIVARSPLKAIPLTELAGDLGVRATIRELTDITNLASVEATIATLPGGTEIETAIASALAASGGPLVDAVYAPWPSDLARAWEAAGSRASSGLAMLLHQAVLQVRAFVTGDVTEALTQEDVMLAKMRSALMGD